MYKLYTLSSLIEIPSLFTFPAISQFLSPSLPPQDRAEVIDSETQSDDLSSTPKELTGFKSQYAIPIRRPKDDLQAQKLYNAIRTVAFYLDAIPGLGSKLPFGVGVDVSHESTLWRK